MKKLISMMLVMMMMVFSLSMAFAKTVEPGSTRINHLAGATVNATVGAYNQDTKTFTVTVYDCDRYDSESTAALETGEDAHVDLVAELLLAQNDAAAARTAKRLLG